MSNGPALPQSPDDVVAYLEDLFTRFDLSTVEGRRAACVDSPLNFALLYLPHHLQDELSQTISFADPHVDWIRIAQSWMNRAASRHAFVAPRSLGKTTWWFLIMPMWAAAFGHARFLAAFADSAQMAQGHLQTFRMELDQNELLRADFPGLCAPMRRNGRAVSDNEWKYKSESGFVFVAKGIDSTALGLKDGPNRPDLIILDDLEPPAANYSLLQKEKRLETLLEAVLYLNVTARVVLCGTVTMAGSIVHDLVRSIDETPEPWIVALRPAFEVHYHAPIVVDGDRERSIWPWNDKFDLAKMQEIRGTAAFAKNYLNKPVMGDGGFWKPDSFRYEELEGVGGLLLSIDPGLTSKSTSDYTGIALIGWSRWAKKAVVLECWQVRKNSPEALREHVVDLIERYPITRVLIEVNQAGEQIWRSILKDLTVPLSTVHQSKSKEMRAARAYSLYDRGLVVHARPLPLLEEQMLSFPNTRHDDMVDSVTSGLAFIADGIAHKRRTASCPPITALSYL